MKELLISFILVLIIGAAINGFMMNSATSPTPEPKTTETGPASSTSAGDNAGTAYVNELAESAFNDTVIQSSTPVLVDFYAPWCGPCRRMAPVIEEIASQYLNKVKVYKINVDNNPSLAHKYDINSIPRFIVFKNGQAVESFTGGQDKQTLTDALDKQLN